LAIKEVLRHDKPFPAIIKTVGGLLMVRRKEAGLTRQQLSETAGIAIGAGFWGKWCGGAMAEFPANLNSSHFRL
jgi:hypothetical protein